MSDSSSGTGEQPREQPPTSAPASAHHKETWLQKRGSKSRLSKQDEVEETDATDPTDPQPDNSPISEASDSTVVVAAAPSSDYTEVVYQTPYPSLDPERAVAEGITLEEHQNGAVGLPIGGDTSSMHSSQLESQLSTDSNKGSGSKTRLQRTNAVNLGDDQLDTALPQHDHYLQVSPTPQHQHAGKLSKDSSMGSENGSASGLSRDSSFDTTNYTDSTGIDLENFIEKTLNKNQKDRMMLLRLEQDMDNFIRDEKHQFLRFPAMTSYHRMLVHRIAAFFGLDHNVDQSGKSVVVNRTPNTRLPDFKFQDHIQGDLEDIPKKILKKDRDASSLDDGHIRYMDPKKSRSFEERKENYEEARKRIFKSQESEGPMHEYFKESLGGSMAILKPGATWSSTESSGYSTDASRHCHIPKAHSLGSTPSNLSRDNSRTSTMSSGSRMSKTDSQSSGISDVKTCSTLVRPPTIPSSPPPEISERDRNTPSMSSPLVHDGGSAFTPVFLEQGGRPMAVWVCTDLDSIPPGSVLINHNTGQPYMQPDGSLLRWPPPKTPGQPPQNHSHIDHKYQDQTTELNQQISQMSLTSPQGPVTMETGGNPPGVGEPPAPMATGVPMVTGGPTQQPPQQPVIPPQQLSYASPVQQGMVGPPAGQMGQQASGIPTHYSQTQQGAYFPGQPTVRYIYNQVQYSSPPGVNNNSGGVSGPPPPPTSHTPEAQIPTVIHTGGPHPISMQSTGPQENVVSSGPYQPSVYNNYPAFQQMTVQSVDYMQQPPTQQQQPQQQQGTTTTFQAPPSGSGGYQTGTPQQPSGQQQQPQLEMSLSSSNNNSSNNTNQPQGGGGGGSIGGGGGGYGSQGSYNGQQPQQPQTCYMPIQYYSATNNNGNNNQPGPATPAGVMAYPQQPQQPQPPPQHHMTCVQATGGAPPATSSHHHLPSYRPKTPPSHQQHNAPSQQQTQQPVQQAISSTGQLQPSSYPTIVTMSQATMTVASGGGGGSSISVGSGQLPPTIQQQQQQQYVSYATYPSQPIAVAATGGQGQIAQPQQVHHHQLPLGQPRMVAHHPHHPHMIAVPPPGQGQIQMTPTGGQPLTIVRPMAGIQIGARSTPPPPLNAGPLPQQQQYPQQQGGGISVLPASAGATPVKVITMQHHLPFCREQMPSETIVNEKGDAGANGSFSSPQQHGGGGGMPVQMALVGGSTPTATVRGFVPQVIRHQNPAAFRTASPVLQPLQNEPRVMGTTQPYPRPVQHMYGSRPRVVTPNAQSNHQHSAGSGSKSGGNRRLAALKQSQDSVESNTSSTDSVDQSPDNLSAPHLLEVTGLPSSLKCGELSQHLSDLTQAGGAIYVYSDEAEEESGRLGNGGDVMEMAIGEFSVLVGFQSDFDATRASTELRSNNSYSLQTISRPYDLRSLCQL